MTTKTISTVITAAIATTAMLVATTAAALPDYAEPEIQARANGDDTFNLPRPSYLNSTSPAISDRGDVAFKVMYFSERGNQGYWYRQYTEKAGQIVYEAPNGDYLSDPKLNVKGQLPFSIFNEGGSSGVYVYHPEQKSVEHLLKPSSDLKLMFYGDPQLTANNELFFRGTDRDNSRQFYKLENGNITRLAAEKEKSADLAFSFLFRATANNQGKIAFKTRLGEPDQWSESAPDAIVLMNTNNPLAKPELIAVDRDYDAASPYEWFGNVVSLSEDGRQLVFVSRIENKKVIVKVHQGQHHIVAREGESGIKTIEPFNPKVNNNGLTAFRAFDDKGLRGIYVADETGVKRLVGEGDMVISDQGKSFILAKPNFPGLAGDVDLNNQDQIVFACVLKSAYTENEMWGSAIYTISPKENQK